MQEGQLCFMNFPQLAISSLRTLPLNPENLGKIFRELSPAQLVFFHGSCMAHVFSEFMCVQSQLPCAEGGLDSSVVFVDGGNTFDPYLVSEISRLLDLNPEKTLKNIWVSRAFTGYQLTALITERLPEILDREDSRLVVVSDVATLYCDSDIPMLEARKTFNRVARFLWNLKKERDLLLVVTSLSSGGERRQRLEQYLLGRAEVAARVEEGNPCVKVTFEKHPSKPTASFKFFFEEMSAQSKLEDFVEV